MAADIEREVQILSGEAILTGNLSIPSGATGTVLFAHGSGSSRHSSLNLRCKNFAECRNRYPALRPPDPRRRRG